MHYIRHEAIARLPVGKKHTGTKKKTQPTKNGARRLSGIYTYIYLYIYIYMYIIQYSKLYNIDLHMYTYLSVKILRDVPFSFFFWATPIFHLRTTPGQTKSTSLTVRSLPESIVPWMRQMANGAMESMLGTKI